MTFALPDKQVRPKGGKGRQAAAMARLCWAAGWPLLVGALATNLISGLLPTATAWLTKLVVDGIVSGRPQVALLGVAGGLATVGIATGVLPQLVTYLQSELRRRIDRTMQDRLFSAVNRFHGLARFESPAVADKLQMAAHVNGTAMMPALTGMFTAGRSAVTVASMLVTLWILSPVMALVVTAAGVPALLARLALSRRRSRMVADFAATARRQSLYSSLITDVRAAKEVRLLGLGDFLKGRLFGELRATQTAERGLDRRGALIQSGLSGLGAIVAGAGLVWAVHSAATGGLSLGDVTAFVAAVAGTQGAMAGLVDSLAIGHEALLFFEYHADIVSLPDDLPVTTSGELPVLRQGIELRDVWFRYDESLPWVLRGVNLTIPYGTAVAIVGLNGAGKSTLVKLLCRFYDPTHGSIRWDGVDIREVPPARLRERMGVLFQDYMSYDLTAAENIGIGDLPALADRDRIRVAAEKAGVAGPVRALPAGYDTMLSRTFAGHDGPGVMFSGGQWQRLALARTLLRDGRDLLILDEPSSGLDARAEHEIHHRLRQHRSGRTSVLVSHRLGAVREADEIVVLSDGKIAESGTHDELIASNGQYAELFAVQARGYQSSLR
ncbi:ABC transporter ATP-binding protein [Fodinicola feengrottensis]|uniref:ABC transporter ATP-binding protein n=2 Tax=Fodinicola feengrottensis TaxID=435914 RepID=A0ABN2FZP4_9ACTN